MGINISNACVILFVVCCAAMSFLIPIGVVVYAAIGGLKATFTTSYMHTVIIFVLCLIFMFKVFVPNDLLGGIDDVRPVPLASFPWPAAPDAPPECMLLVLTLPASA